MYKSTARTRKASQLCSGLSLGGGVGSVALYFTCLRWTVMECRRAQAGRERLALTLQR